MAINSDEEDIEMEIPPQSLDDCNILKLCEDFFETDDDIAWEYQLLYQLYNANSGECNI